MSEQPNVAALCAGQILALLLPADRAGAPPVRDLAVSTAEAATEAPVLAQPQLQPVDIVFIADPVHEPALAGARLGLEDSRRSTRVAGLAPSLRDFTVPDAPTLGAALSTTLGDGAGFFVLALSDELLNPALDQLSERDVLVMNLAAAADGRRGPPCVGGAFHIAPSLAQREAARRAAGMPDGEVLLWVPGLQRYAAGQLTSRFLTEAGRSMRSEDWAAWFAVGALARALAVERTADPGAVRAWLGADTTRLHNYKGAASHFDPSTYQLQQPLFVRAGDGSIATVPAEALGEAPAALASASTRPAAASCAPR
ncbi:MAG: hypothetical protein HXY25_06100, partial [Alphaproteobacteria bacterium]|nr:hypothetical protein [Alphaproteobacteria bacterium]